MTDLRHVLAANMKAGRKKLGLSQAGLAEKLNTATNYISKIESEKQFPSVQMLERIALALGVDTLELFSPHTIAPDKLETARRLILADVEAAVNTHLAALG
jgi:transcriptional regulator with XRE-family HTH domain